VRNTGENCSGGGGKGERCVTGSLGGGRLKKAGGKDRKAKVGQHLQAKGLVRPGNLGFNKGGKQCGKTDQKHNLGGANKNVGGVRGDLFMSKNQCTQPLQEQKKKTRFRKLGDRGETKDRNTNKNTCLMKRKFVIFTAGRFQRGGRHAGANENSGCTRGGNQKQRASPRFWLGSDPT